MSSSEAVVFLLISNDTFLAEEKGGKWAIPGGKIEKGETIQEALKREVFEEVNVKIKKFDELCTLWHSLGFPLRLHFFVISDWEGEMEYKEADSIRWLGLNEIDQLHLESDRAALREYGRLYLSSAH